MKWFFAMHDGEDGLINSMDGPFDSEGEAVAAAVWEWNAGEAEDSRITVKDLKRLTNDLRSEHQRIQYVFRSGTRRPVFSVSHNGGCLGAAERRSLDD